MSSYAFERNESCFLWSGVFYTYILLHHGHLCCSNYLHHLRFLCLLSLSVIDNVTLKAATLYGCVFSSFKYVALSFIWIYVIACMHIHIASIFYNFNSFIFMKGAYLCLVLFFFFFFWSLLFQTSVEPLQLFYVWCSHGIILFFFFPF